MDQIFEFQISMLEQLPYEMYSMIIYRIPLYYLKELTKVNKEYNRLFAPLLWRKLQKIPSERLVEKYGKYVISLKCSDKFKKYTKDVDKYFPILKRLDVSSLNHIQKLLKKLFINSKYEKYEIYSDYITGTFKDLWRISSLRHLDINHMVGDKRKQIKRAFKHPKKVKYITAQYFSQIAVLLEFLDETKKIYLKTDWYNLKKLKKRISLYGLNLKNEMSLPRNIQYEYLTCLYLNYADEILIANIYNNCTNLKKLHCKQISDPNKMLVRNNPIRLKYLHFETYKHNEESKTKFPDVHFISSLESRKIFDVIELFPKLSVLQITLLNLTGNEKLGSIKTLIINFSQPRMFDKQIMRSRNTYENFLTDFPNLENLVVSGDFFDDYNYILISRLLKCCKKEFDLEIINFNFKHYKIPILKGINSLYQVNPNINIIISKKLNYFDV